MIALLFWLCVLTIFYSYFGYPLLVTLLARLKPAPPTYHVPSLNVTLLIAAYNEEAVIERKILNALELDWPKERLQILVAADGSSDHTAQIAGSFQDQGVELSYIPDRGGKMAAINRAMPKVRGDIIVFSDANNLYDPSAVHELVAPFMDARVGAVTGAKTILSDESGLSESEGLYWRYESFIKKQETRLGCSMSAAGEILAIRRDLYIPPPPTIINDDFYIVAAIARQGYNVIYNPRARSYESVSATAHDEMVRRARIIAGRYQVIFQARQFLPWRRPLLVWQIVSHKFSRPLVPFAMIGALITNLAALFFPPASGSLLRLAPPYAVLFFVLQLIFYGMAFIGSRLEMGGPLGKLLYVPTFLVNSNFAALSGLYTYLTRRQLHLWERVQRRDIT
jgi:cellulose synthase/poly-beta-1,6-N-acetylglucosamine synthase-like glycosyltransferase